jgi:hypothetical protein
MCLSLTLIHYAQGMLREGLSYIKQPPGGAEGGGQ